MSLPLQEHIERDGFCLRGLGMSHIDGFSDVVFGFALTLLVVSLEVPRTILISVLKTVKGHMPPQKVARYGQLHTGQ